MARCTLASSTNPLLQFENFAPVPSRKFTTRFDRHSFPTSESFHIRSLRKVKDTKTRRRIMGRLLDHKHGLAELSDK